MAQKAQRNAQLRSEAKLKAEAEQKAKEEAAKKQANRPYKKYGSHGGTGRSVIPGILISE